MKIRFVTIAALVVLLTGCATTGGHLVPKAQSSVSAGKAVVAFSIEVADGTRYDQCSVFVGRSAATAQWFGWNVAGSPVSTFVIEVGAGDYGFHRFGCSYRGFTVSSGIARPEIELAAGEVRYLGRLTVDNTKFGSAARRDRVPTSVDLTFSDASDEDLRKLRAEYPLLANADVDTRIPESWGGRLSHVLRPYQEGIELVAAPIL